MRTIRITRAWRKRLYTALFAAACVLGVTGAWLAISESRWGWLVALAGAVLSMLAIRGHDRIANEEAVERRAEDHRHAWMEELRTRGRGY